MVWLALIIPFITAFILWFGFERRVTIWELFVPMGVSALLIWGAKNLTEYIQCADTEYWTGWVVKGEYSEYWNELHEWDEIYTEEIGSGNSKQTVTRTHHHRDIIGHPAYWIITDSNGISINLNSYKWEALAQKFKNRKWSGHHPGHTISGEIYQTIWPGDEDTLEVVTTAHKYQNRVQASESVFKFTKIGKEDKETLGLFDYPPIRSYTQKSILGFEDPTAERKLSLLNAKLGRRKQIKVFICVFKNQPLDAAIAQMNFWEGGNKNELVLTIGVDNDNNIQWGYVFSWTEKESLKVEVRDLITNQKSLNLTEIVEKLTPLVESGWERKRFRDFNYLSVEPPWWTIPLIYLLTLLTNIGLSVWFITAGKDGGLSWNLSPKSIMRLRKP